MKKNAYSCLLEATLTMSDAISLLISQIEIMLFCLKVLKMPESRDKNKLNNDLVLDIKVGLLYAITCNLIYGATCEKGSINRSMKLAFRGWFR